MTDHRKKPRYHGAGKNDLVNYVKANVNEQRYADSLGTGVEPEYLSSDDSNKLVDAVLQGIVEMTTQHGKLSIRELGNFRLITRAPREVKGYGDKPVSVPAYETLAFTASKLLRRTAQ